jgi:hypothetical protein
MLGDIDDTNQENNEMTKISKTNSLDQVKKHLTAECFNKLFIGGQFVDPIDGQKMPTIILQQVKSFMNYQKVMPMT